MDTNSPKESFGSKLLPKSITSKRRRRKAKEGRGADDTHDNSDGSRGRSPFSIHRETSLKSDGSASLTTSQTGDDDDGDSRSFGSFESRTATDDSPVSPRNDSSPTRPGIISQHPSHVGYLTTSSPVVLATHIDSTSQLDSNLHIAPSTLSEPSDLRSDASLPELSASTQFADGDRHSARRYPNVNTDTPPRTPPTGDAGAPTIVNTPPTPTRASANSISSRTGSPSRPPRKADPVTSSADGSSSSQWNMSAHRRSRSGSATIAPTKLSTVISAPLSPAIEGSEPTPTPHNTGGSSFFSSMFTAAQTAANNISNNIQGTGINIGGNKPKQSGTPQKPALSPTPSQVEVEPAAGAQGPDKMDSKESAVRTMGAGDLNFSHLGLNEPGQNHGSSLSQVKLQELSDNRARSESAPVDTYGVSTELLRDDSSSRPRSLHEPPSGERTPPQLEVEHKFNAPRSPSMRSTSRRHRKRNSSVTTAGTAAALGFGPVQTQGSLTGAPKLSGFAVASAKRNRDFHTAFKSVPDDDYLIEDYSCALQREILAHGRLYVSEGHLCFSSNILGWATTLVMSFDEIVSVEKRSTALVFKNGLEISTLHAKHIFASFTSRDATYDLIVNIWKLGHPTLKSTLNGVQLEGTGGDKTEKVDGPPMPPHEPETRPGSESEGNSDGGDDESSADEEEGEDDTVADVSGVDGSVAEDTMDRATLRNVSGPAPSILGQGPADTAAIDFPGPVTHAPTECGDVATHYDRIVGDDVIPAPLGKVYNLLFGQPSVTWMPKWLASDQKCTELSMDSKKGLGPDNNSRSYSYIKPLGGAIGPKQTKCIVTESIENLDFEKAANLVVSTQTPDVPSGNVFVVKTKYCLSWAENNQTRIQVNCTIEWSGKSWFKGPIEKGANEGQTQYAKDLCAALKTAVSSRPRAATGTTTGKGKKKSKRLSKALQTQNSSTEKFAATTNKSKSGDSGPFSQITGPISQIVGPLFTGNVMYGLLVGLLVATWFNFGSFPSRNMGSYGSHPAMLHNADRLAAFDQIWQRDENALWDWLDERVGLGRLDVDVTRNRKYPTSADQSQKPLAATAGHDRKQASQWVGEDNMDRREVEEAIRVTEEKLRALRETIGRTQ